MHLVDMSELLEDHDEACAQQTTPDLHTACLQSLDDGVDEDLNVARYHLCNLNVGGHPQ